MTKKNMTRNALVTSIISLLLCVSMLVGTTFAWFTDSVESLNNVITAGNLDIEVTNENGDISGQEKLFQDVDLWEPGVVAYENLTIENVGTLALKYEMSIVFGEQNTVTDNDLGLADVLKIAVIDEKVTDTNRDALVASINEDDWTLLSDLNETGNLYPKNSTDGASEEEFAIIIWWEPSDEDNKWNVNNGRTTSDGEPLHISLGLSVLATQLPYEEDSYGKDYDEMLPETKLENADDLENVTLAWGSYGVWTPTYPEYQTLEAVYTFTAPHTAETIDDSKYKDWYCDFVVSLDREVTMTNDVGDLFLGGNYGSFGWVGFENPIVIAANEEIPLLGSVTNNPWTYKMVATQVGTFTCGVARTYGSDMDKLAGATFTVKLQLTNPATSEVFDVAVVQYTFPENPVATAEALKKNLAAGKNVTLISDIDLDADETIKIASGDVTIDLNGHTIATVSDATGSNRNAFDVNGGTLTVKNGTVTTEHVGDNMNWNNSTNVFNVTAGGVLNIENATIVNNGGSDMAFGIHLNNWGEVTLNITNSTIESTYCPVRVFNSGNDMNNVTIKNSTLNSTAGNRALWVHNYTAADFGGSEEKAAAHATLLNFNIYGNGNTFVAANNENPILYGFTNSIRYTAEGVLVQ